MSSRSMFHNVIKMCLSINISAATMDTKYLPLRRAKAVCTQALEVLAICYLYGINYCTIMFVCKMIRIATDCKHGLCSFLGLDGTGSNVPRMSNKLKYLLHAPGRHGCRRISARR